MQCPSCQNVVTVQGLFCVKCGSTLETKPVGEQLRKTVELLNSGKLKEADKLLSDLYTLYPDHPTVLNNIGVLHLKHKNKHKAREWFRKALAVDPYHEIAKKNLAITSPFRGGAKLYKTIGTIFSAIFSICLALYYLPQLFSENSSLSTSLSQSPFTVTVVQNNLLKSMDIRLKVTNRSGKMVTIYPDEFQLLTADGSDSKTDSINQPVNIPDGYSEEFTYFFDIYGNQKPDKLFFQPPTGKQITIDVSK